jgi:hypothetical protein
MGAIVPARCVTCIRRNEKSRRQRGALSSLVLVHVRRWGVYLSSSFPLILGSASFLMKSVLEVVIWLIRELLSYLEARYS